MLLAGSIIILVAAIPSFMGNHALSRADKYGVLIIAGIFLLIAVVASDTVGILYRLFLP